jgi:hypothetical protein
VDHLVVADVDAHVSEPIEEHEIAGLKCAEGDGDTHDAKAAAAATALRAI